MKSPARVTACKGGRPRSSQTSSSLEDTLRSVSHQRRKPARARWHRPGFSWAKPALVVIQTEAERSPPSA